MDPAELNRRADALRELQRRCQLCPRRCGARRQPDQPGFCRQPAALHVARVCAHGGEEPALSGSAGAGTVFVAGCTMRCGFCQNHQISHARPRPSWRVEVDELARALLELQARGAHNVEWISPTQHLPGLVRALAAARARGLRLPVVYNSSGYERVAVLRLLEGVVDVYLPDAKYADPALARRYSTTMDYVEVNRRAIAEMARQVGTGLALDAAGIATRGLVIRHLVLPGALDNTHAALTWIADAIGRDAWLSLMAQYQPAARAAAGHPRFRALGRPLTRREYDRAVELLVEFGFDNGWVQEHAPRARGYLPDFERAAPFAADAGRRTP